MAESVGRASVTKYAPDEAQCDVLVICEARAPTDESP
jgi:hypothetical protein